MRKTLFNLLPLLAIYAFASGQSNFVKSVVINNNGDSVYGNIDYRNWKNNPQTIIFKNAANEVTNFDASSIMGFYVPAANEIYASYSVKLDMMPGEENLAIRNSFIDSPTLNKRVFLLQLVKHPALRLYHYSGDNKEHFYYIKGKEEPVELVHHFLYDASINQVTENVTYKEQLSGLFAACPTLAGKLKTIKFRKKEIQDIFQKYLQCSDPGSVAIMKKQDSTSIKFGVVGGLSFNQFKFEGTSLLADANYSSSVSPLLGVSLDIGLSRNRNKWHIVNELVYKSYKTSSSFTRPYGNGYSLASDVDLHFSYAQINTLLRYVFNSNASLNPYINLGIGNAFMIAENKNNIHKEYSFDKEENEKAINSPNKYEFSLLAGAGLVIRRTQLEFRYGQSKKSFSPYLSLEVNPVSFQIIFTYQF